MWLVILGEARVMIGVSPKARSYHGRYDPRYLEVLEQFVQMTVGNRKSS